MQAFTHIGLNFYDPTEDVVYPDEQDLDLFEGDIVLFPGENPLVWPFYLYTLLC